MGISLALGWVVFVTCVGAALLYRFKEYDRDGKHLGLCYSFDMLLPVIRLREHHYDVDLTTKAKYYFYVHKIVGYVLVSAVIAGLSDLAN